MLNYSRKSPFNLNSKSTILNFILTKEDIRSSLFYGFVFKRLFDILLASIILLIVAIPMLAIVAIIKLDSPGSVFFSQPRVGLQGKQFKVLKLRTMVENADSLQAKLENSNEIEGGVLFKIKEDPRITRVGKYLRRYSIDEIPQLINVIKGDMSLVGPRPLTIRDSSKLPPEQFVRYQVLPGVTGMWQVYGRSNTNSKQLYLYDRFYISRWSLKLDLAILLKTVLVVIEGRGAY